MLQPKLRRVLAVLALTFATTFALEPAAGAAARVRTVKTPRISWRAAVSGVLEKIGVRIDPDGLW
jgi:hypothetical protein